MIHKQRFISNIVFEKYCLHISEYSKDRISKQGPSSTKYVDFINIFLTLTWTKFGFLWTTYPFHLAHVVFERHPEVNIENC